MCKLLCRIDLISNLSRKRISRSTLLNLKRTRTVLICFICFCVIVVITHVKEFENNQQLSSICNSVLEFVHITNTGGTFIEQIAANAGVSWGMYHVLNKEYLKWHPTDWEHFTIVPWRKCRPFYNESVAKWHVPGRYLNPNPYKSHKTFTVVRNPYTRMISEYYSKWSGYEGKYINNVTNLNTWIQNKISTRSCGDVYGFLQNFYVYDGGIKVVDHVLRYERLMLEFNDLMDEYNMPIRLALPINEGNGKRLAFQDLTPKTKNMIAKYAKKDFEIFQYTYDVCGNLNLTRAISHALFPERIESENSTIMFVSGICNKPLNGVVLYIDGENGNLQIPEIQNMYYMGPLHFKNSTLKQTLPYVHVVGTTLMNSLYTANDFLHRRFQSSGQRRFMIYIDSHCGNVCEKAFDDIVHMARNRKLSLPVAAGKCHGSYPSLSEYENDWNLQTNTKIQLISGFRFALVMEKTNEKGYITERIADAFIANTIPIYYGTTDVFKLFNKDAFIYYDIMNPVTALGRIANLESNHTAYEHVLSQPILANGHATLADYFSISDDVGGGKLKQHIRRALIGQTERLALQLNYKDSSIPREIYMLWDSGWERAPIWQQTCLRSWQHFNPTHIVHALDLMSAEKMIDREFIVSNSTWSQIKIQAKSDIIRILILSARGGFWADASVACNKPLDEWVDYRSNFITFRRDDKGSKKGAGPKHELISPWITSWFIGGPKTSYVLQRMRDSVLTFWLNPTFPYEYFWLHRLFANLVADDKVFASAVNVSNLPSGDGPHCLLGALEHQTMFKRCNQLYVYKKEETYLMRNIMSVGPF